MLKNDTDHVTSGLTHRGRDGDDDITALENKINRGGNKVREGGGEIRRKNVPRSEAYRAECHYEFYGDRFQPVILLIKVPRASPVQRPTIFHLTFVMRDTRRDSRISCRIPPPPSPSPPSAE